MAIHEKLLDQIFQDIKGTKDIRWDGEYSESRTMAALKEREISIVSRALSRHGLAHKTIDKTR